VALLETLQDDFSAATLDTAKWTLTNGTGVNCTVTGATFNINTISGQTTGNTNALLVSTNSYTFKDSFILGRVFPPANANQILHFRVRDPASGEFVRITKSGTNLTLTGYTGTATISTLTVAYSAAPMAWWRIRHSDGTLYWETAPDGTTWTAQHSFPYTLKAATHRFELESTWIATSTATTVSADEINVAPISYPPVETLTDDFLDPSLTAWTDTSTAGNTATADGGFLTLATTTTAVATKAEITSTEHYKLTGSAVYGKFDHYTGASVSTELTVAAVGSSGAARMSFSDGRIYRWAANPAGTQILNANTLWGANLWTYWRIRLDATGVTLSFDRSPDAITWTTVSTVSNPGWGGEVEVRVGLRILAVIGTGTRTALVDAINLLGTGPLYAPTGITDAETLGAPDLATSGPSKIESLQDDFDGSTLNAGKWRTAHIAGSHTVSGGTLNLALGTAGATDRAQIVSSLNNYQLSGSSITAKFTPSPAANTETGLVVANTTGNGYASIRFIGIYAGCLLYNTSNAVTLDHVTTNYVPAEWAYVRIRQDPANGSAYFYRSPDGLTWVLMGTAPAPGWGSSVEARLTLSNWTTSVSGQRTASFDSVNVPPANQTAQPLGVADVETLGSPTNVVPTVADIVDDFLGTTLDPAKWTTDHLSGSHAVFGGLLRLTLSTNGVTDRAGVVSVVNSYRFTGSAVYAKINASTDTGTSTEFVVANTAGNGYAAFRYVGPNVTCRLYSSSNTVLVDFVTANYVPTIWVYVRLRMGTDGTVYFDVSPDLTTWYLATSGANPGWGGNTQVQLRLSNATTAVSGTRTSTVDSINMLAAPLPPPQCIPDSLADPETLGSPTVGFLPPGSTPDTITDPETLAEPGIAFAPTLAPDGLTEIETLGEPELPLIVILEPDAITDTETITGPTVSSQPDSVTGNSITDLDTLGAPDLGFRPSQVEPGSIADPQALGAPTLLYKSVYNGAYSTGVYGVGPYQGLNFSPTGINNAETLGEPAIYDVPPVDADNVLPLGIHDPELLGLPEAPRSGATNYNYGAGTYNAGIYYGGSPTTPKDNIIYSTGTYGYGIYYGVAVSPPGPAIPLFPDAPCRRMQPPLHILGIGPWSPALDWRGVPNYGVKPGPQAPATRSATTRETSTGPRTSRPAMALPPTTSKGFTLRLNDGSEARAELRFNRGSAIVIDEMDTDLWWRRKDPRTGILEMIGRFNTAHTSLSTSDTGIACSVQFVDYRTILGERMILKYLRPNDDPPTTMWNKGTPVTDILAWALPDNTGLDLSAAKGPGEYDLGNIIQPFHLPPGTLISDLMDNLVAVSPVAWEWWVDTPLDINQAPKLMLQTGARGQDKGVVLFDAGSGPTPIASWTRNAASDDYANSIYYTGGGTGTGADAGGGVVRVIDAQIQQYGQRDVQDGNSSLGGDINQIRQRAEKKLQKYADRRPSYTVRLRQGFWRGRNHIDAGDHITLLLRLGKEALRDTYRVSEIAVDIDENGLEDVTLTLGRMPASADPRSKRSPITRIVRYLKNYMAPDGSADIPTPDD
jgi:hypothetical protein